MAESTTKFLTCPCTRTPNHAGRTFQCYFKVNWPRGWVRVMGGLSRLMMDENKILQFAECIGTVAWRDHSLELCFDVAVAADGSILIDLGSHNLASNNQWLHMAYLEKSPTSQMLSLQGYTQDRYSITSDSMWLTKSRISATQDSATLKVCATASRLIIQNEDATDASAARWEVASYIAGLRSFGPVKSQDSIGTFTVTGSTQIEDYQRINGRVIVNATLEDGQNHESWLSAAEQKTRRVLDILSFADGHFLRTSIRKTSRDGKLHTIHIEGARPTSQPYKPPLAYLQLNPVLEIALRNYTDDLIQNTGMDVAMEWHLMPHEYDETGFLGQMTALEHLVHMFSEATPSARILPRSIFRRSVRPALDTALDQLLVELRRDNLQDGGLDHAIEEIKLGLGNLNRRSFLSNVRRMLKQYRVPLDGLEDLLPALIQARNEIVHRGLHAPDEKNDSYFLGHYLAAAEELLRRVFLSLLNYSGHYRTYFETIEDRPFRIRGIGEGEGTGLKE